MDIVSGKSIESVVPDLSNQQSFILPIQRAFKMLVTNLKMKAGVVEKCRSIGTARMSSEKLFIPIFLRVLGRAHEQQVL